MCGGTKYILDDICIIFYVETGLCEFTIFNVTDPLNEFEVGKITSTLIGLQIVQYNDFYELNSTISVLQIRGKAESTKVYSFEVNMK